MLRLLASYERPWFYRLGLIFLRYYSYGVNVY